MEGLTNNVLEMIVAPSAFENRDLDDLMQYIRCETYIIKNSENSTHVNYARERRNIIFQVMVSRFGLMKINKNEKIIHFAFLKTEMNEYQSGSAEEILLYEVSDCKSNNEYTLRNVGHPDARCSRNEQGNNNIEVFERLVKSFGLNIHKKSKTNMSIIVFNEDDIWLKYLDGESVSMQISCYIDN